MLRFVDHGKSGSESACVNGDPIARATSIGQVGRFGKFCARCTDFRRPDSMTKKATCKRIDAKKITLGVLNLLLIILFFKTFYKEKF